MLLAELTVEFVLALSESLRAFSASGSEVDAMLLRFDGLFCESMGSLAIIASCYEDAE